MDQCTECYSETQTVRNVTPTRDCRGYFESPAAHALCWLAVILHDSLDVVKKKLRLEHLQWIFRHRHTLQGRNLSVRRHHQHNSVLLVFGSWKEKRNDSMCFGIIRKKATAISTMNRLFALSCPLTSVFAPRCFYFSCIRFLPPARVSLGGGNVSSACQAINTSRLTFLF